MRRGGECNQAQLGWMARICCLLLLFFVPYTASAAVGQRIVEEAVDASDSNIMRLELRFELPISYLWHFPQTSKDQFLIAIQPIQVLSDDNKVIREHGSGQTPPEFDTAIREHIRIPPSMSNIITNLYYDGTEANSRFVVLETSRDVGITVKQGVGGRTLIVEFNSISPEPASECDGKAKKDTK